MFRNCFYLFTTIIAIISWQTSAEAAKIYRTTQYYTISGKTSAQLDEALAKSGPFIKSTGMHHPGVTTLSFAPHLKLRQEGKYCKVALINVDVRAKVQLPRWKQRSTTKSMQLAVLWDVLSRDISRHEESHIVIARSYASEIEYAVMKLPVRNNCTLMKEDIDKTAAKILIRHDEAQKQFDRVEMINFDNRFMKLLVMRLEQLQSEQSN